MGNNLALVLGGGGARGALQVGALRALLSAGLKPDMLVGTSVGAVNATYLALNGFSQETLQGLEQAWHDATSADLLAENFLWLGLRFLLNRPASQPQAHMREFFLKHGVKPEKRFADIEGIRLILVSADLNHGCPVLFGEDPNDCVLDGLLASTAIPPWIQPIAQESKWLIDGGLVSNLPIEPAIRMGADEIIALDLMDFRDFLKSNSAFAPFLGKLMYTVEARQLQLETALAQSEGVRVHRLHLLAEFGVPLWDFRHSDLLIEQGYQLTQQALHEGVILVRRGRMGRLAHQLSGFGGRIRQEFQAIWR
jgi:NTE family protein